MRVCATRERSSPEFTEREDQLVMDELLIDELVMGELVMGELRTFDGFLASDSTYHHTLSSFFKFDINELGTEKTLLCIVLTSFTYWTRRV